jgi:Ca-activated chloride channel family protein
MIRTSSGARGAGTLTVLILVAACGGGSVASPTPPPLTAPPPSAAPPSATAVPTDAATGPASLTALDSVQAGVELEVTWTGPNAAGDYVTIVKAGTTAWTNEDYFYTTEGSPAHLNVPSADGAYELWYVSGADKTILSRRPLTVTPFEGDLLGPDEVGANTEFEVAWNGPNGTGDYVTIVKAGATKWTNEDYFYTTEGSPSKLLAPVEAGAYELWYVIGSDSTIQARRPITVKAATATLEGPKDVARGASFEVTWTGPNGPGDYVTILAKGTTDWTNEDYFYTRDGNPGTLAAPDASGDYQLVYITGQGEVVLVSVAIMVK